MIINNRPLIGVVVPIYKVKKKYLDQCVRSIIDQTYSNLQIILVDDCSPDECGKWCKEYASYDERIEVYHHDGNKGLPAARNTGFFHLKENCEWVTFVDSDDWLDSDTVEVFVKELYADQKIPDVVLFPACRNYPEKEIPATINHRIWKTREELDDLALSALSMAKKKEPARTTVIDSAWAKFVSVPFMKTNDIVFRQLPYREDGMFFQEIVDSASCILEISKGMYHYRETNGSMVNSYLKNAPYEQKLYLDMLNSFFARKDKSKEYFDGIYYYALISMQTVITQCFYHKANPNGRVKKKKECQKYFSQPPYIQVFTKINIAILKRNYQIKALCIKYGWYKGVDFLRRVYLMKNKQRCFE